MAREKKPILARLKTVGLLTLGQDWTEKHLLDGHIWQGKRVMALDGVVEGEPDRRVYLAITRRQADELVRRLHAALSQGQWHGDV